MQKNQSVSEMATEVLARQAGARAKHTGESLEEALRAVLQTEAGRRLGQLRDGDHRDERADQWQPNLPRERAEERREAQLAELLGEALAGESPAALGRLALEDQRQAEEGLVALTSNGKTYYKLLEELTEGDMGARIAADRSREAWLKERRDGWLDYGGGPKGEGRL